MTGSFDPLDFAFRTGQELYKAGLLALINTRRQARGLSPAAWPQIAATATETRWSDGGARLLRYRRDAAATARTPILLVCSLINRPYVLDLLPERSVVRRLLDGGHDVWLLDWGTPTSEDAARSFAAYTLDLLPRASDVVMRETGAPAVHLLGYCMGGTMSLAAVAAGRVPAASLVAMATPVDMHDEGLLSTWCRTPSFDAAELVSAYGNVPPYVLQPAFKMLDPVGLATKLLHLEGKIDDDYFVRFFLAMETWLEDSVAFPGRAFVDWVALYRSNALVRGDWTLDGAAIDLGRISCPIFNIVADGDYITPPSSSLALEKLVRGEHRVMRLTGGHIGLSTGRAAHHSLWPAVSQWLHAHDATAARAVNGTTAAPTANGATPRASNGAAAARSANGAVAHKPATNGATAQKNEIHDATAQKPTAAGASAPKAAHGAAAQKSPGAAAQRPADGAAAPKPANGAAAPKAATAGRSSKQKVKR